MAAPTSSQDATETPAEPQPEFKRYNGRLGMPFDQRVGLADFSAFGTGFLLGASDAGRMAGLRFRAENAHRLPTTRPGWYLYHKTKNYYRMKAGIKEGVKKGSMLTIWATAFFLIEESVDVFRGTWRAGRTLEDMEGVDELDLDRMQREIEKSRDFWSTSVAGIVTGGLWSAWNHFPANTAARTMRMGLLGGLIYGLAQDGLTYLRVNKVGYMANPWWEKVAERAKERKRLREQQTDGAEENQEEQKS